MLVDGGLSLITPIVGAGDMTFNARELDEADLVLDFIVNRVLVQAVIVNWVLGGWRLFLMAVVRRGVLLGPLRRGMQIGALIILGSTA
jgi:hypothetical protein